MHLDLAAEQAPTQLPVAEDERPIITNRGPGVVLFGRTATDAQHGTPLGAGAGYEFSVELRAAGWPAVWVYAETDATVTVDTVG